MTIIDQILKFFGEVILIGGSSAAVAYLLFQYLGKGWIDARFAERLEAFKHQQAIELSRLKVEVDSALSGTLKIQEREFAIIPDAWHKLTEAYSFTAAVTSPLQSYPDLERMSDAEVLEFLDGIKIRETQKAEIRQAHARARGKIYQEAVFWHTLHGAKKSVGELQNYVIAHGVFLPAQLKKMFQDMVPILHSALVSAEMGHAHQDFKMQTKAWEKVKAEAEPLHSEIEKAIEIRLHSHKNQQLA
jgi:hypothetical protein